MGAPEDIVLFEKNLNELTIKYEHYFLGLEKREPLKLLEEVEKLAKKYSGNSIVNTMLTFKYNTLKARFVSYKQYWQRTTRQIEEGRYSRDRFKMGMHQQSVTPSGQQQKQTAPESEADRLYRQFLQARRACNLSVENLSRETVIGVIEKHKRAVMEKYRCTDVELLVTTEGGTPKLKIRPKR